MSVREGRPFDEHRCAIAADLGAADAGRRTRGAGSEADGAAPSGGGLAAPSASAGPATGAPDDASRSDPTAGRGGQGEGSAPPVAVIMGSQSDWATMRHAADTLVALGVAHEARIVSAHRTPERLYEFARSAASRGTKVIIAGAGGAAHLPGMVAALTRLPVLGVPVESRALSGLDSLYSIVQMPAGVPVGTLAVGNAGAVNAALLAAAVLALADDPLAERLAAWRAARTAAVAETPTDGPSSA